MNKKNNIFLAIMLIISLSHFSIIKSLTTNPNKAITINVKNSTKHSDFLNGFDLNIYIGNLTAPAYSLNKNGTIQIDRDDIVLNDPFYFFVEFKNTTWCGDLECCHMQKHEILIEKDNTTITLGGETQQEGVFNIPHFYSGGGTVQQIQMQDGYLNQTGTCPISTPITTAAAANSKKEITPYIATARSMRKVFTKTEERDAYCRCLYNYKNTGSKSLQSSYCKNQVTNKKGNTQKLNGLFRKIIIPTPRPDYCP